MIKSAKITYTIISGQEVLSAGHEYARNLWNFTRYCAVSFNYRLHSQRIGKLWNDDWKDGYKLPDGSVSRYARQSAKGLFPAYPGYNNLKKELRAAEFNLDLSSRCFEHTIEEFDIAMRSWFSNLKSNPKARPPRYCENGRSLTFGLYTGGNAKHLGDWIFQCGVLSKHHSDRKAIVKLHIPTGVKVKDISRFRLKPDGTGSIVYQVPDKQVDGNRMAAIDLGIINIVAMAFDCGHSVLINGRGLLSSNQYYAKRISQCKPAGWKPGSPDSSVRSKNELRFQKKKSDIQKLAVHNLTRFIVNECIDQGVKTLVIGDLKGIRDNADYGKRTNQKLHNWPFAEIRRQLEYKCKEYGIEVIAISERNTSKCCMICGKVGTRNPRGILKCKNCNVIINSDVNGAFNILNKYRLLNGVVADNHSLEHVSKTILPNGKFLQNTRVEYHPDCAMEFDECWRVVPK